MRAKKTFGYIFIVVASILLIVAIEKYQAIDSAVKGIFMVFTGELELQATWRATGRMFYWVVHIMATFLFWIYGKKWLSESE